MGFLGQTYNTNELPEGAGFDVIPAGWYDVDIQKAEMKDLKNGPGQRLNLQLKVTGPNYIGRVVFASLNIDLPGKAEAERIGREQLGNLLRSIGLDQVEDSDELVGYSLRARVKIKEGNEDYPDAKNEVAGFKAAGEAPVVAPVARPNGAPRPAARPAPVAARATPAARPQAAPQRAAAPAARAAAAPAATGKKPPPWARKK
jgi:hypothetical protein